MEDLVAVNQLWALLVSIAVPFVVGLLTRKSYQKWVKVFVAFVLSAVVGVVSSYLAGQWNGGVFVVILACYGTGQVTFWLIVSAVPGLKDWLYGMFNRDPKVTPTD